LEYPHFAALCIYLSASRSIPFSFLPSKFGGGLAVVFGPFPSRLPIESLLSPVARSLPLDLQFCIVQIGPPLHRPKLFAFRFLQSPAPNIRRRWLPHIPVSIVTCEVAA
jgi:hypothetical protein